MTLSVENAAWIFIFSSGEGHETGQAHTKHMKMGDVRRTEVS